MAGFVARTHRPVHGQAAHDFVNDKGAVKTLLRANGFRVPEGAVFARDQYDEAEDFFSTFIAACPAGACMKPTRGGAGKRVFVGVRDVASRILDRLETWSAV